MRQRAVTSPESSVPQLIHERRIATNRDDSIFFNTRKHRAKRSDALGETRRARRFVSRIRNCHYSYRYVAALRFQAGDLSDPDAGSMSANSVVGSNYVAPIRATSQEKERERERERERELQSPSKLARDLSD